MITVYQYWVYDSRDMHLSVGFRRKKYYTLVKLFFIPVLKYRVIKKREDNFLEAMDRCLHLKDKQASSVK